MTDINLFVDDATGATPEPQLPRRARVCLRKSARTIRVRCAKCKGKFQVPEQLRPRPLVRGDEMPGFVCDGCISKQKLLHLLEDLAELASKALSVRTSQGQTYETTLAFATENEAASFRHKLGLVIRAERCRQIEVAYKQGKRNVEPEPDSGHP